MATRAILFLEHSWPATPPGTIRSTSNVFSARGTGYQCGQPNSAGRSLVDGPASPAHAVGSTRGPHRSTVPGNWRVVVSFLRGQRERGRPRAAPGTPLRRRTAGTPDKAQPVLDLLDVLVVTLLAQLADRLFEIRQDLVAEQPWLVADSVPRVPQGRRGHQPVQRVPQPRLIHVTTIASGAPSGPEFQPTAAPIRASLQRRPRPSDVPHRGSVIGRTVRCCARHARASGSWIRTQHGCRTCSWVTAHTLGSPPGRSGSPPHHALYLDRLIRQGGNDKPGQANIAVARICEALPSSSVPSADRRLGCPRNPVNTVMRAPSTSCCRLLDREHTRHGGAAGRGVSGTARRGRPAERWSASAPPSQAVGRRSPRQYALNARARRHVTPGTRTPGAAASL